LSSVLSPSRVVARAAPRAVLAGLAAIVVLSGCSTFTDDSVAARVDGVELTEDQMAAMLRDAVGDEEADVAPMTDANEILNNFVLDRVLRHDLDEAGASIPDSDVELTRVGLQESVGLAFTTWQTTQPTPVAPELVRAKYELGPADSNMTCTSHILVEAEATANEVLGRIDEGDDFGILAAEYSIDPGSAAQAGALPCDTTGNFQSQYIPEYVDAALAAEIGEPVGPVESQFGFHVILVRPFDDLAADELDAVLANPAVRFDFAVADLDVYVNPRYGAFDASRGVVPLG
jgi:parvulin-like peptidyl-prolyl isomerase